MKKAALKWFTTVYLFFLIYYPPVFSVNVLYVQAFFSWLILFVILITQKGVIKYTKDQIKSFLFFLVILLYLWIVALVNKTSVLETSKSVLFWLVSVFPSLVVLNRAYSKLDFSMLEYLKSILDIGLIQAFFSIFAFFNSGFQSWFLQRMIAYGYSATRFSQISQLRWFGFASKLGFTTPAVQCFLGVLAIYLSILYSKKYLIYVPFLLFSAIINARIVFLIFLAGVLIIIVNETSHVKVRNMINLFLIFLTTLLLIPVILQLLKITNFKNYEWFTSGISQMLGFSDTAVYGIGNYFFDKSNYLLPEGFHLLFGTGNYANGDNKMGFSTDIGYINDIWLGGIFFAVVILIYFIHTSLSMRKYSVFQEKSINNFLAYFFLFSFFILNIKGYVFSINEFSTLFFSVFFFLSRRQGHNR